MLRLSFNRTFWGMLAAAVYAARLTAQVDTGNVSGFVRDASNAMIPAAAIEAAEVATAAIVRAKTSPSGFYSLSGLKPGTYKISASATGFESVARTGIEVHVQDRLAVDFELPVGSASTILTINSQTPLLETETSSLGHVVPVQEIESLPLNGRNYIQLATLAAGTTPSQRSSERNSFVSNGARPIQNSYLLDGVENKNKIMGIDGSTAQAIEPVLDAVEEFKVQTSTFSAEFGQAAGAVVNVTLKSGTNRLHGSLFEFNRNSYFDALPYFQPPGGATPAFNQNQFGATAGGPIRRNQTFAFFAWQSSREVNAAPQLATVPTEANREGAFSTPIYDPSTTRPNPNGSGYIRTRFPNDVIPLSRFDSVAAKLLAITPLPNLNGKFNFFSNQKEAIDNDQFNGRADHRIGDKDNAFFRYSTTANTNVLPATLPPPANTPSVATPEAHSLAFSETHIFRPNLINEARVGYLETRLTQTTDAPRLFDQFGIKGAPDIATVGGLPTFAIAGFSTLGTPGPGALPTPATGSGNLPIDKQGRTIQFNDNVSSVAGPHALKYGVDIQQVTLYASSTLVARPAFNFNGGYTKDPQKPTGGSALADFLLGQTTSSAVSTRAVSETRQHIFQSYLQDDWKLSARLTLNAGVRYELPMPFYETADNYADVILEPGSLYGKLLDAHNLADSGYRNSFSDPNWHNLAPRIGMAFRASKKTVIRSAFGVFYGRDENIGVARRPTNNPPYYVQSTYVSDSIKPSIILSQGFPADALDPATVKTPVVSSFAKHAPTPYVQQWNLNVQRGLGGGFVAQAAYVGSSSHDLYYPAQIDTPQPGNTPPGLRRPLKQYSSVFQYAPLVSANYESLQASLERRFERGFSVLAAYTLGHSIDNGSSQSDSDTLVPQNPNNFKAERGNSNFDIRQRFVLSFVYDLPFGKGKTFLSNPGFARAMVSGWQVTGIFSAQTGLPFTPVRSIDGTNTGTIARPDRSADGSLPDSQRSPQRWFDATAFTAPAGFSYGNSGRDILRGPGFRNLDIGLSRFFRPVERCSVEFRAEAFNVLNTPQLGLPNAVLGVGTTGVISSVVNPQRELQLALRMMF